MFARVPVLAPEPHPCRPHAALPRPPGRRRPPASLVRSSWSRLRKGVFEFETYPAEAPKTVARIVELVKQRFYNGMRIHRVVPGFVIQLGDPQTRDMTKKDSWGTGGSGKPIGVAEITKTRTHVLGAVAMAHAGDPAKADSQILRHAGAGGAPERPVHRVRQGHERHGRRAEDPGRGSSSCG